MKTISERIFENHIAGGGKVCAGDIIFAKIDRVMTMDHIASVSQEIDALDMPILNPDRFIVCPDHNVPANSIPAANNAAIGRAFCKKYGIKNYFEIGRGGICHLVVPEQGLLRPGELAVGTDSHSCTYGAFCVLSTGVGMQDAAAALVTGELWFRVPESIKIVITGTKQPYVQGKDIMLGLLARLGVGGAIYRALEFTGPGLESMSITDRISVSNMAVEMGAKTALFETDEVLRAYFEKNHQVQLSESQMFFVAEDEAYENVITFDIDMLGPLVAVPDLPENAKPVEAVRGIHIDQAFLGSCSNGSFEDMVMAADVLRGKKIAGGVRMIVLPGTQQVYLRMLREGIAQVFIEAGAIIGPPTCGPCSGTHFGLLADGEVCVATINRNYTARMGSVSSKVYLANPAVVAASAVKGEICAPGERP
jgi:3-isopropylmalate/(R)-2-methylmalate dehydratase large subunit